MQISLIVHRFILSSPALFIGNVISNLNNLCSFPDNAFLTPSYFSEQLPCQSFIVLVTSPEGGDEGRGRLIELCRESPNLIPENQQASHLIAGWDLEQPLSGKISNIAVLRGIMTPFINLWNN